MKKRVVLLSFFIIIFILPFITSLNQTSNSDAIKCIENKVQEKGCVTFGLDSKIFALLSTGQCEADVLAADSNDECFVPVNANSCELKTTSQAVLALDSSGSDTDKYANWILAQNKTATGIDWLLQIETSEPASCDIKDLTPNQYQVSIDQDKKLSLSGSANCLSLDSTGYWLKINPQCQAQEFEVKCDKAFQLNLLFRKQLSSTIYVFDESVKSETAGGTDFIKARESLCFKKGNSCDYEGSLWATLVLKKLGKDVSSYLPYLIVFEEDNKKFLPESFLYFLTAEQDFKIELLSKQIGDRYWDEAYDRYYDTALALMSISSEQTDAKDNAVNWLAEVQGDDGCWDSGNVAKTGFLLYSLWPSSSPDPNGDDEPPEDCEDLGNFCVSNIECLESGGDSLSAYNCPGLSTCCTKDKSAQTCSELGGEICDSSEDCDGIPEYGTSDLLSGESCCIGTCKEPTITTQSACEENFGTCKDISCESGEKEDLSYACDDVSQYCCMQKTGKSLWWLWALGILIILIALAIVFKDKLKDFYDKLTIKKKPSFPPRPGIPQRMQEIPQRRIIPQQQPQMRRPFPQRERKSELDDVLKKLKEMGK
ncbi:MAG: hypothetical protein AABY06_00185 [Nanoarchaeota archaeon]